MTEDHSPHRRGGSRSITLLVISQVCAMSVWFSAAAVIPSLAAANGLDTSELAALPTATQLGFVCGAILFAVLGLSDRIDPRRLFAVCAVLAAVANLWLLLSMPTSHSAIISRLIVGICLAGVYPVGLKMAMGWSQRRRALLASLLVAALTVGSSMPHLVVIFGGMDGRAADWRAVLGATSLLAVFSALLMRGVSPGPFHAPASRFSPKALLIALREPAIRRAYFGYFGHMWELYAFWAWAPAALVAASIFGQAGGDSVGETKWAAGVTFTAMIAGAIACIPFGRLADRYGKDNVARLLLAGSGLAGLASSIAYLNASPCLVLAIIVWGIFIIPDSPLFSAMVGDHAEAEHLGSLITLQTALGFGLTVISVQLTPFIASHLDWNGAFLFLVPGPIFGILALRRA